MAQQSVRHGAERDLNPRHLARQRVARKGPLSCPAARTDSQRHGEHHELLPSMELPRDPAPREVHVRAAARLAPAPMQKLVAKSGNRLLVVV